MMQKSRLLLVGIAFVTIPTKAQNIEWFDQITPLTQAHQNLLNNNLEAMFNSLVEVWQLEHNKNIQSHLNELLLQSLTVDCGKSLDKKPLPEWLKSITINRQEIQSPGRDAFHVDIEVDAEKPLADIRLAQWVDKSLSTDSLLTTTSSDSVTGKAHYLKRYNLNSKITMGLYRLDITAKDQQSWSAWIVLGEPKAKQIVRWASKDQWQIEKKALLNPYCPLPELNVSLYDYIDGKYSEIWSQRYESEYPNELEITNLAADRYVLAVSMTQQRWQGPLIIEQSQVISKTYDVSVDE
ncbi:DUF2861 family protein [Vibrio anguillarum]|uniref:DUF2861 family protein n=1 Tax=Vibrio anguillarum TaxID=55601 RepID=UPI00097E36E2|nr:DUF2861 family protein [Vibrio anguillarum]MBF4282397.1 DUF2861 family protein [Vibrio anguillarum]MBF4288786.1 DUF2861 family protein [Vibrio anguillarum]MBF4342918.1 DUF2861 family protein [Vibrio anguillarum]MBF4358314.1 DUF2861 family protein [Vibrio anguillarum]MBF4380585.1 DUF2861 family protein [Vibrio anguillarum]